MTNDEERQLRQELLAVELSLKRKQEFWETPRNIAILVGLTALIAGAIGFWLGRESTGPPAPIARPVATSWFGEMRGDEFVDLVQTAGIVAIAAMLAYVITRLERAVTTAAQMIKGSLGDVMKTQNQLQQNVRRVWERIDLIESKQGNKSRSRMIAPCSANGSGGHGSTSRRSRRGSTRLRRESRGPKGRARPIRRLEVLAS